MELKLVGFLVMLSTRPRFNRTFMELKFLYKSVNGDYLQF